MKLNEADDSAKTVAKPLIPAQIIVYKDASFGLLSACSFTTIGQLLALSLQLFPIPIEAMAPARTKKPRTSTEASSIARPQTITLQSPTKTPVHSPQKQSITITEGQKQALIDNLQLESENFQNTGMLQTLTSS